MTHEPSLNTLTWTLDYSKNSDVDDSVGHWQVMKHPKKSGFTRILYSTKIKMMPWIPEFFIEFMTGKALTEATGWLKRESELAQKVSDEAAAHALTGGGDSASPPSDGVNNKPPTSSWFKLKGGSASPSSSQSVVRPLTDEGSAENKNKNKRLSIRGGISLRRFFKL
eukprot:gene33292-41084_t